MYGRTPKAYLGIREGTLIKNACLKGEATEGNARTQGFRAKERMGNAVTNIKVSRSNRKLTGVL